jgi:RecA-family ATPase
MSWQTLAPLPPARSPMPKNPETLSFGDLRRLTFPPETHIISDGILKKNSKLIVAAAPKSYKSFMVNTMIMQLLTGGYLFGTFRIHAKQRQDMFHIEPVKKVLVIEQELGLEDNRDRLMPYWESMTPQQQAIVEESLMIHSCNFRVRLDEVAGYKMAREIIGESGAQVVVFDPLIKFHRQNENDPSCMNAVMCNLSELSHELDFTSVIIHHHNKNVDMQDLNRLRGGSSIAGDLDTCFQLNVFNRKAAVIKVDVVLKRGKPIQSFLLRLNPETLRMEFKDWYEGKRRDGASDPESKLVN